MAMPSIAAAHPVLFFPLQHYPSRLHRLYLVDVPTLLKWLASGVLQTLQPETRAKASLTACFVMRQAPTTQPRHLGTWDFGRKDWLCCP